MVGVRTAEGDNMAEHKTARAQLCEQANKLVQSLQETLDGMKKAWVAVHELDIWECGDCGHGGTGDDLGIDEDGAPECPWCDSDKVRPRAEETDLADATDEIAYAGSGEHDAFFSGEFDAWMESMQADGYASDDVARVVKAECEALLGGR